LYICQLIMKIMRLSLIFLLALAGFQAYSQNQVICAGQTANINAASVSTLNPPATSFTLNPGNQSPQSGNIFVVSPNVTTNYTILASNGTTTQAFPVTVSVNPQPIVNPTFTQLACNTTSNAFNFNLTFSPANPVPTYTITWDNGGIPGGPPVIPTGWAQPMTAVSGSIAPGAFQATLVATGGCSVVIPFTITPAPAPANFSFSPSATVYSITCSQPSVNIAISDPALNYTWTSNSTSPNTNTEVTLTYSNVGTWTVTAVNPNSGCSSTKTFVVGQNTVAPSSAINPTFQAVNCTVAVQTVTLTALSPTVNFTHFVYSPVGGLFVANTQTAVYQPGAGTYTYVLLNNANGCMAVREFTVSPSNDIPTFSLTSAPAGFSVGCLTKSCTVVNIINAQTQPTVGGAVSYSMIPPNGNTLLTTGVLTPTLTYTLCTPGLWTAVVRDDANGCVRREPFSVVQYTLGPPVDTIFVPRNILNCDVPSTTLSAVSSATNTQFTWFFPGNPNSLAGSSITVNANTVAPTNSLIATYTLVARDPNNLCITTNTVPMLQNLYPPKPFISSGGTTSLTCGTPTIVLTNQSSTGIPPNSIFPTNSLVVGWLWQGPSPQLPLQVSSTYYAAFVGTYSLTVKDYNNGCTSFTTIPIGDFRDYPILNNPPPPGVNVLDCGAALTKIYPSISTATSALSYTWTSPVGATVTGANTRTLSTNMVGTYTITVTNTLNSCSSTTFMTISNGTLGADFSASAEKGYAPLTVNFLNNSSSTTGNSSITSVWNFNNGTYTVTKTASEEAVTVFKQPGTYTVTMYANKGSCMDTAWKVIQVDLPSRLVIPNIFTPNGDKVNDLYFLGTTNLSEINALILDRWGNKVYELISETGNVAWDGKNQTGQEVPDGVYYYIIKAKGKDGGDYNEKGTITLVR
jgi:gliding motility-associated-like protein